LIARLGLEALGIPASSAAVDGILELYLEELQRELQLSDSRDYRVHAGVEAAIQQAAQRGFALGLGTGNILAGARLKLEHVGLFRHFAFGGYGCDHEVRVELIRIGAERGAALLGRALDECRVVVIGDTPKDVDAARGIGAESIGVGTGPYTAAQLREHGATHAFDDLTAPGAMDALLGHHVV
jgi:phosphoglycolate phosphatase